MENIVVCSYCDQVIAVEENVMYMSEEEKQILAMSRCNCSSAKWAWGAYQTRRDKIQRAHEAIDTLFENDEPREDDENAMSPEAKEAAVALLHSMVEPVTDGLLHNIGVSIPGGVKATIAQGAKDTLKIKRSDTSKREMEV